jgi:hypothetical protein
LIGSLLRELGADEGLQLGEAALQGGVGLAERLDVGAEGVDLGGLAAQLVGAGLQRLHGGEVDAVEVAAVGRRR